MAHMDIDRLLIARDGGVVIADAFKQVAATEDAPRLLCKEAQDLKLRWGERDLLPSAADAPPLKIDQ